MMKQSKSFLTRCLALALALLMAVSCASVGLVPKVFAASASVKIGQLVADYYGLTPAEKALITADEILGGNITYPELDPEGLVTIDSETKTITAKGYEGWYPTVAEVIVDKEVVETITLVDGVGKYTDESKVLSVDVAYQYDAAIDANVQEVQLFAAKELKRGLSEMETVFYADAYNGTVVDALALLNDLADGITVPFLGTLTFKEETTKDAVAALNDQINANGGMMDLQIENADYEKAISKTAHLYAEGEDYYAVISDTYAKLNMLANDGFMTSDAVNMYMEGSEYKTAWGAFKKNLGSAIAALEPAALNGKWITSAINSDISGEGFVKLDQLLAAIDTVTETPAMFAEVLPVATSKASAMLSMYVVTVNVSNSVYVNEATNKLSGWEDFLVTTQKSYELRLPEGKTSAEILDAIKEAGFEVDAISALNIDTANYDRNVSLLPEVLMGDTVYAIDYAPKQFAVSYLGQDVSLPYGFVLYLEKSADAEKAFDYSVNGKLAEQGTTCVITGDTVITRNAGKAYNTTDLYTVVAGLGTEDFKKILTSGALLGNETIKYRSPDPADSKALLSLKAGVLTAAEAYSASYNDLNWVPYTYGTIGNENAFTENIVNWTEDIVNVHYALSLTNFSEAEVKEVIALAALLKEEAAGQLDAMSRLLNYKGEMETLNKTKLGALNGVIDVTDMTPDDNNENDATNLYLRKYFSDIVTEIIKTRLNGNELKILAHMDAYSDKIGEDGLTYYYKNAQVIRDEVSELSRLLNLMTADDQKKAALKILAEAADEGGYAEKIDNIGTSLAEINADLKAPNAKINVASQNLAKLAAVLENEKAVVEAAYSPLKIVSPALSVADDSIVYVQITINVSGKDPVSLRTNTAKAGMTVDVEKLIAEVNATVAELTTVDNEAALEHYKLIAEGPALESLVNAQLQSVVNVVYTYQPVEYAVIFNGISVPAGKLTVIDSGIEYPLSVDDSRYKYEFTVNGEAFNKSFLTPSEISALVADGALTIDVNVRDLLKEKLDDMLNNATKPTVPVDPSAPTEPSQPGTGAYKPSQYYTNETNDGFVAEINPDKGGADVVIDFFNDLTVIHDHIAIGEDTLAQVNEEGKLEISLQTLINAMLNDNEFGSERVIALGENNGGLLVSTVLTLKTGNANARSRAASEDLFVKFDLILNSVPDELKNLATYLDAVKQFVTFQSNNGVLDVNIDLPEKVYEAYLTAMLITGDLDLSDVNAMNHKIAYAFFEDYFSEVMKDGVTAQSFQNTYDRLDNAANKWLDKDLPEKAIAARNELFQSLKDIVDQDSDTRNVTIDVTSENGKFDLEVGAKLVHSLMNKFGFKLEAKYETMIKEFKTEGAIFEGTVVAAISNFTEMNFDAAMVDLRNDSKKQKLDYSKNLVERVKEITGEAAIILLDDVYGDLVFNDATILDLNGKTVHGSITGNGRVIIMDSNLGDNQAGEVTGNLNGTINILGGKYNTKYASRVVDGYAMDDEGYVYNVLFTKTKIGDVLTYNLNSSVIYEEIDSYATFATALAADVVLDFVMNYYSVAALYVADAGSDDFNRIYDVDFDDLIKLIDSKHTITDVVNEFLEIISLPDLADVVNDIAADMLNFEAAADALRNGTPISDFQVQTHPWHINFKYVEDGDYFTGGIVANEEKARTVTINISVTGAGTQRVAKALDFMGDIVLDETKFELVDVENMYVKNRHLNLAGGVVAHAYIDLSDYTTFMAIIMANGTEGQKRADLVAAVNNRDNEALKEAMDVLSVKDVFSALKELQRNDDFAAMAEHVGMNVDINFGEDKELLEKVLIAGLAAAGKALEKLEIEGIANTLGGLETSEYGWYQIDGEASRSGDIDYRSIGIDYDVKTVDLLLKVKLFEEEKYLLGDVNLDGKVTQADMTMVAQKVLLDNYGQAEFNWIQLELADVNRDGKITQADVTILCHYAVLKDANQAWKPIYITL